jgi:hypothetical protein
VPLAAGSHRVTFVYRPRSALLGALISVLSSITLLAWARGRRHGVTAARAAASGV